MWISKQYYEDLQERASQENFIETLIKSYQDLIRLEEDNRLLEEVIQVQEQIRGLQLQIVEICKNMKGEEKNNKLRRFNLINPSNETALNKLLDEKHIVRDDLILILSTLELKDEFKI